ncbi:MAG: GntR family transcriptional regulator [Chloroflexi bacterium]|nr:GntR family transcriptional regulator [Chloroflexota bacterium]
MLPSIDRTSPVPIYQQIQAWIREQILTGAWVENHQLPAEDDLAVDLGVNRGTLRNAIKSLIDEGFLIRIHGKGTFVAKRMVEQSLAQNLNTFSEGLMLAHIAYTTRVLEQRLLVIDPQNAELLELPEDEPLFFLKRVREVKDQAVIYLHNYVVARHCPGIETYDFAERRLFDVMERDYHLRLAWGRRAFEARAATAEVAEALDIAAGAPVMYVRQLTYSPQDTLLEFSDMWIKGDSFRMSAIVRRDKNASHFDEIPQYHRTELTL